MEKLSIIGGNSVGNGIAVTITVNESDATFQWLRDDEPISIGGQFPTTIMGVTYISGPTLCAYTIGEEDIGRTLRCQVTYTDDSTTITDPVVII